MSLSRMHSLNHGCSVQLLRTRAESGRGHAAGCGYSWCEDRGRCPVSSVSNSTNSTTCVSPEKLDHYIRYMKGPLARNTHYILWLNFLFILYVQTQAWDKILILAQHFQRFKCWVEGISFDIQQSNASQTSPRYVHYKDNCNLNE